MPLGSGRVGSDDLGYGPGSGFSFEPVQTSSLDTGAESSTAEEEGRVGSYSDKVNERHENSLHRGTDAVYRFVPAVGCGYF